MQQGGFNCCSLAWWPPFFENVPKPDLPFLVQGSANSSWLLHRLRGRLDFCNSKIILGVAHLLLVQTRRGSPQTWGAQNQDFLSAFASPNELILPQSH